MGHDATNYLPVSTSKRKIVEFLKSLGFQGKGSHFRFYKDEDYKYLYGVLLEISEKNNELLLWTRTPIYCSADDLKYQNHVIKRIEQQFGGYFISDYGKNRYFHEFPQKKSVAERGCYTAHFKLANLFTEIELLITNYNENQEQSKALTMCGMPSCETLLSNILTTYLSSIIENFFRELYVALLKQCENRENIITSAQVNKYDLFRIAECEISIEEAIALSLSFQNIHKINHHFERLDKRIKIKAALSKPYRNRKENLYNTIDRILEQRHSLVHRMNLKYDYDKDSVLKDVKSIKVALSKVYLHLCEVYGWEYDE